MKPQKSKTSLFDKYSENLKYFLAVKHDSKPIDVYLCPLSMAGYSRSHLYGESENQLTVEHVPPKSMGGKPVCLLSKEVNSTMGHTMDKVLLDQFIFRQFIRGGGSYPVHVDPKIQHHKFYRSQLRIKMHTSDERPMLEFDPGVKNFKKVKNSLLESVEMPKMTVKIKEPKTDEDIRDAGYLRIAYLLAFEKLGYALIFNEDGTINETYEKVRQQILNPDQSIIDKVPMFSSYHQFDDGVYIISSPKKLRSLMVALTLSIEDSSEKIIVMLPLPQDSNFEAYRFHRFYMENAEMLPEIQYDMITNLEIDKDIAHAAWLYNHLRHLK